MNIKKLLRNLKLNSIISILYNIKTFHKKNSSDTERLFHLNRHILKKKELVFDIGANIGDYTELYRKIGFNRIISIEPQKKVFDKLQKRFQNYKNIIPIKKGIGNKHTSLTMHISEENRKASTFSKNQIKNSRLKSKLEWNTTEIVEIITVEELIKEYGIPDFIKIDVEGFELEVFKGLKTKIQLLQFEFLKEENMKYLQKIFNLLKKIGPYHYNISTNIKSHTLLFKEFISPEKFIEFIMLINDKELAGESLTGDIIAKLK